jgi:hypothetical protein
MHPSPKQSKAEAARYRAMILARKPWQSSTGPRTVAGMRTSSGNAVKHGTESAAFKAALRYIARIDRMLAGTVIQRPGQSSFG